ncbi:nicotinate phosphoribosyltransferase [Aliifodinibius salicampi]|uniref:Nicotinate phosphoribosyltransferase n=1 Tax=Fodinibius salicampi TaxID=1920655 RepID=A0ABT3PWK0_9BACT|nr:nicotinate phosphoribosyltransferase [Fodinibius salicampi]MCW9712225.1 nicotinate phosphoribosyltransferase [Fodinibius salicampi]
MSLVQTKKQTSLLRHPAIYTDYYELTMAQGYYLAGRKDERACFDYFFRDNPFDGGYVVFAGLADLLELIDDFQFHEDEIQYLAEQGFRKEFLNYLRDFRLQVDIDAAKEGEIVFPSTPLLRVEGSIIETQILETLILNILNFESLIATKASRMKYAAGDKKVLDFGLRRAQGYGGIQASKAAIIGGVEATSNTYSSFVHDIPASGTMAHSWIQSFDDELTAFRKYAEFYPDDCILLVDTYSTLKSGVPNAIKVAKELEEKGHRLKGIRLDSGDLAYFARKSRQQLDEAGLDYVKIAVSNQLDEHLIKSLLTQNAPIDLFGVGTRLATGNDSPALDGVYKLASVNNEPKLKLSENVEKITLPGRKKVMRYSDSQGRFYGDGILLMENDPGNVIHHPHYPAKHVNISSYQAEPLLSTVVKNGKVQIDIPTPIESAQYAKQRLSKLNEEHKRFDNPHIYKVGISEKLMDLRDTLTQKLKEN